MTSGDAAWVAVLDRLERDVEIIERFVLAAEPNAVPPAAEPWDAPTVDGPIPPELLDRAVEIQRRQRVARAALASAMDKARAQQPQVRRSGTAAGRPAAPAYVDVSA